MPAQFLIPAHEIRRELTVLNSRFIATLAPVSSVEEAKAFVGRIREEFAGASHHVPAYIIDGGNSIIENCSDDGEPAGTAGRPSLAVLRGSGLGDVAVVVTRYFGGTLLGTGGLVRAYTESVQMVVRDVARARRQKVHIAMLALPYNFLERLRILVKRHHGEVLGEDFAADITMTMRFPVESFPAFETDLQEISSGQLKAEIIESAEMLVPVE
jgi:uncharacterized YigZ family protein